MDLSLESLLQVAVIAGPITSLGVLAARKLASKYGLEASRLILQGILLVLAVTIALVITYAPTEVLATAGAIFATAIAFYEVLVKGVFDTIYKKITKPEPEEVSDGAPDILPE